MSNVRSLLEIIHDYQELRGRRALGVPLDDTEQACLVGLARLLRGDVRDRRRDMPRAACPMPARLTLPDGFAKARVRNLSGSGMALRVHRHVEPGTRLLVHVDDPIAHIEHVFPARAIWCDLGTLGVAFDGVPSRSELRPRSGGSDRPRPRDKKPPLVA